MTTLPAPVPTPDAAPVRGSRGRGRQSDGDQNRREQLLDAAEELFAQHGFDGVTVRQVATLAGTDVALPNYYFGSKQGMFDAVFDRRARLFNQARTEAIDRVLQASAPAAPMLEELVAAFLEPIAQVQSSADPGWRNYCRLVALVNSSSVLVGMMTTHYDALVRKFVEALHLCLPDVPLKDLYWYNHFLSGALSLTMANTGRIDRLSDGLCRSDDTSDAYGHMVSFFANGFKTMATARPAE